MIHVITCLLTLLFSLSSQAMERNAGERLPQSLALTQPGDSPWSESFGHDALLRLQTLSSPAGTFTYHYTGAGSQVQSLLLSSGSQIANSYDDAGQLLSTTPTASPAS